MPSSLLRIGFGYLWLSLCWFAFHRAVTVVATVLTPARASASRTPPFGRRGILCRAVEFVAERRTSATLTPAYAARPTASVDIASHRNNIVAHFLAVKWILRILRYKRLGDSRPFRQLRFRASPTRTQPRGRLRLELAVMRIRYIQCGLHSAHHILFSVKRSSGFSSSSGIGASWQPRAVKMITTPASNA